MLNKFFRISILLIFFIFLTVQTGRAAFNDVGSTHFNFDAIGYVQSEGIVQGYDDGTYRPSQTINRAEFMKIVIEAQFDAITIDNCIMENRQSHWTYVFFPDIPINQWFAKYICVANQNGIIQGYPDGTFKPAQNISFVEAAKIIVTTFNYEVNSDPIWYKPFVERLGDESAIPSTIGDFEKEVTRGEMAEMIYRLKAGIKNKTSMLYRNGKLYLDSVTKPASKREFCGGIAGILCAEGLICEGVGNYPDAGGMCVGNEEEFMEAEPMSEVKEFNLTAKQWEFTPSTITVKKGDAVRLIIESIDVAHGFAMAEFNVNKRLNPGATITVEFVADRAGTFPFFCSVLCGSGHSKMKGKLVVEY